MAASFVLTLAVIDFGGEEEREKETGVGGVTAAGSSVAQNMAIIFLLPFTVTRFRRLVDEKGGKDRRRKRNDSEKVKRRERNSLQQKREQKRKEVNGSDVASLLPLPALQHFKQSEGNARITMPILLNCAQSVHTVYSLPPEASGLPFAPSSLPSLSPS